MGEEARNLAVLDESVLEELSQYPGEKGASLLEDVLELYVSLSPDSLDKIKKALVTKNSKLLESEAHKLKSSSGNIGAYAFSALCRTFEKYGAEEKLDEATRELGEFEAQFALVLDSIKKRQATR